MQLILTTLDRVTVDHSCHEYLCAASHRPSPRRKDPTGQVCVKNVHELRAQRQHGDKQELGNRGRGVGKIGQEAEHALELAQDVQDRGCGDGGGKQEQEYNHANKVKNK